MKRTITTLSVLAVLLLSPSVLAEQAPRSRIQTQTITEKGSSDSWGYATTVIRRPMDKVLDVVVDYDNYHRFLPHFRKSKVLARRGNRAMVYMEVGLLRNTVMRWAQVNIAEQPSKDEVRVVEANFMDGNIKKFRARFTLKPHARGKATRIEFQILVDPAMPVPAFLVVRENEKAAGKTLRALQRRVLAGVPG